MKTPIHCTCTGVFLTKVSASYHVRKLNKSEPLNTPYCFGDIKNFRPGEGGGRGCRTLAALKLKEALV